VSGLEREQRVLHAYHDGELGWWGRRRFERRLQRSRELRRELERLRRQSAWVRQAEGEAEAPDLWGAIAAELPAIDVRRGAGAARRREPAGAGWGVWLGRWPAGVAAALATALVAVLVYQGSGGGGGPEPSGSLASAPVAQGTLRFLNTEGHPVMVMDEPGEVTIIWLMDAPRDAV
jgi:hypothetical protein